MALPKCQLGRTQPPTHILDDMKIELICVQLRRNGMLKGERVVGGVGDHGIAAAAVVGISASGADDRKRNKPQQNHRSTRYSTNFL
jgi:hypothetical protein